MAVLRGESARQAVARMRKRDTNETSDRIGQDERQVRRVPVQEESDQTG